MAAVIRWLNKLNWVFLLPIALALGLAPFLPQPHLLQKLQVLAAGGSLSPVDVFDLALHGGPLLLVMLKLLAGRLQKKP